MKIANEKADISHGVNSTMACTHCLELYERLDTVNERLYLANERERMLVKENDDLKVENSALKASVGRCCQSAQ